MTFPSAIKPPLFRRTPALIRNESGIALTEFAVALPFLIIMASSGLELTNYALTVNRIGQLTVMVADNASRMGAQSAISNKPISEAEINDVFIGADLQASGLDLANNSRIILSSLQRNDDDGQTIKWQRCFGSVAYSSPWGQQGTGDRGTSFAGVGPTGSELKAASGTAVMVVEMRYRYRRLMPLFWLPLRDITETSAFNVRDSRDLGMPKNTERVTISSCPSPT